MGRILFALFLFLTTVFSAAAQTKENAYQRQWNEIDSLIFKQSLSRSALQKVNAIYEQAKKNNQQVQVIKALLYKLNLEERFQEKDLNKETGALITESQNTKDVLTKSILYSLVAEKYSNYFESNRWNLYQRSKTVNYKKEDIATWSADDFHAAITHWYQQSLTASAVLKQANVDAFKSILTFYNTKVFRPSLYDLLAHRALEYFKSDETYITKPLYAFAINEPAALGSMHTFIGHSFTTKDSISNKWKALLLFQELIRYHLERKDTAALIDVNLERIEFAKNNGSIPGADTLYYTAVKENAEEFKNNRYAAQAWYLLAAWHSQKANRYNANSDTTYRWENVKALEICEKFMPLKDSTEGHYNLFNLYHSIVSSNLAATTEQVNVPNTPFRTFVSYKNAGNLYYRIIKSTKAIEDSIQNSITIRGWNSQIQIANTFPFLLQQQVNLPVTNDYQQHSTEIKMDALSAGKYFLLGSSSSNFSDSSHLVMSAFFVSNISFINNGQHYFVLDRTTGQPLKNASVQIWMNEYNNKKRRYEKTRKESYKTDENGYFKMAVNVVNNRGIQLDIKYNKDELFLENEQYTYPLSYDANDKDDASDSNDEYEQNNSNAFFFKDRSIYRPGQVVYFKMISLTKDRKTKKTKLYIPADTKDSLYVYLEDVNNKKLDSLKIKLNEYGSFAGNFKLPVNALTGEFSLSTNHFNNDKNGAFSVEEYKRPTFYVQLEKPKGTYRLKDTLTVTGTVKAYSGNTVDGANIKFRVTRKGRFLYPWLWYKGVRPSASETTIIYGEATTDAAGKFTVKFAAIPDETVAQKTLPVFDFEVNADVTDIAGETRSSSTTVSVGYHSLNVKLSIKETAEADSLKSVFVSTENIAGDKEPATVTVSVSPLSAPKHLIRKRYWQQPDQYLYTQEEYNNLFPNDEYKNESDQTNWPKSELVFTATINTKETGKVELPKGRLTSGWYVIEAVATDKDGHQIKDKKYVQLYSRNDGQFNSNSYLFTSVNNNLTTPGMPASFLIGSSAEGVHLIEEVQHKPKDKSTAIESDFTFHEINKAVKEIVVTPAAEDIGGMGVNFAFVKDNRVYTVNQQVQVEVEKSNLNVEVLTYRDKIEPGSQEKWTIKITGKNKDAAAAEVLTSMYDASLDQFKPHTWQMPSDEQSIFYANGWNNTNGFMIAASSENNTPVPNKYFRKQYADIDVYLSRPHNEFVKRMGGVIMEEDYDKGIVSAEGVAPRASLSSRAAGVDVAVIGYGAKRKSGEPGATTSVTVRGLSSLAASNPLYVVDGKMVASIDDVNQEDIAKIEVLKDAEATALYGARGANGVVLITTKNGVGKEEPVVKVRTNFNETAFFFPQLVTDKDGSLSFTFTLPDALTQWKWQMLAHDKLANFGINEKTIVSQKTLMIQANAPRFFREGDRMEFSAKVSNLSDKELTGKATLTLVDAITLEPVDDIFSNTSNIQNFTAASNQSTSVNFSIAIPANFNKPVTWQIVAKANQFADGEENTLPVLTNRMLVTESLPLFVKGDTTKKFEFTKLLHQQSKTLKNEAVTVEYTSNPVWYAVQSLPYLIEFPEECSEQAFNRFFANALASKIINSNPKIKQVFDEWKKDTSAFKSNLQKNEELKNILLQETPWVLHAENEEQQKKNLALLFDAVKLEQSFKSTIAKLGQMQENNGGFPWFKGGHEDRYITQYIVTGIGRLQKMNAIPTEQKNELSGIAKKALAYLDDEVTDDYNNLKKYKADLAKNNTGAIQIQYLYARSFFTDAKKNNEAYNYFYQQSKQYWAEQSNYFKAMIGEVLYRNNESGFVTKNILPAIMENAVTGEETGMYWKQNEHGYYWYQAPVEQQALMIEFVSEVTRSLPASIQDLDEMKTWLLRQKQTNNWSTTKATADACYALLLNGSDWVSANKEVSINLGSYSVDSHQQKQEAGSGYFKTRIEANKITPAMGEISVTTTSDAKVKGASPSWGAVYWQYFEELDKITPAATPLSIHKKLFVEKNTDRGVVLQPVNDGDSLYVGDRIKIRIEIRVDRNMEYVQLKDMRAAGMEPINVLSGYKWQDGLGYYESTRDAATNFFISYLQKGTYVFEYPVNVTHNGDFSVGIASAQCMYAPEFNSHSEGIRIKVEKPRP